MRQKPYFIFIFLFIGAVASGLKAENQPGGGAKAPAVPTGFAASASGPGIQLSWEKAPVAGTRFNLYLADEKGTAGRKLTAQPIADNRIILEKMKPAKTYHFILTAVGPAGMESGPTEPLEVQPADPRKPAASGGDESSSEGGSDQSADNPKEEGEEPFTPDWTGEVGYTFSTQPSPSGQGQVTQELTLTGTYNFTKSGNYLSLASGGGQEVLEGLPSSYGTFSGEGGLGLGIFLPTLEVAFQQGAQASNSIDATLTLNFQIFKAFELGATFEGNPESHQAPLSQIFPTLSPLKGDKIDEIDSVDWCGGIVATITPWDFLDFTLTGQQDYARTYQYQNILHSAQFTYVVTERIPSGILGANLTFLTDFTLAMTFQAGLEYIPPGPSYNPVSKKTVDFAVETKQSFSGYSLGLTCNL